MDRIEADLLEFSEWFEQQVYWGVLEDTPVKLGKVFDMARKRLNNLERMALDTQRLKKELRDIAQEKEYGVLSE